jgi:small subunit ribosomal protein S10
MNFKLTIQLSSVNQKIITFYLSYLINIFKKLNLLFKLNALPLKKKRITLLRSPHVFKKSREQFEVIKYKYVLTVFNKLSIKHLKILLATKPYSINMCLKVHST